MKKWLWLLIVPMFVLSGCGKPPAPAPAVAARTPPPLDPPAPGADAGVPLAASTDMNRWRTQVMAYATKVRSRPDPFKLLEEEQGYEARQTAERLVNELGGFHDEYVPPVAVFPEEHVTEEPQPYRRLAGIYVGDTVLAIIDMGDGKGMRIVRPGELIPESEWTVVSIDSDKAILRRGGTRLPHEVTVRLESRPNG